MMKVSERPLFAVAFGEPQAATLDQGFDALSSTKTVLPTRHSLELSALPLRFRNRQIFQA